MIINLDQRGEKRFHYAAILWHENILPGRFYKARIYNISRKGLYFESDQTLYQDEEVYISDTKPAACDNSPANCTAIIIKWRKELRDSVFQFGYGAKFSNPKNSFLKTVNKKKLIGGQVKGTKGRHKKDPREHIREIYRKGIVFTIKNRKYKGLMTNISRGGAFITTRHKFALGQFLKLDLQEDNTCKNGKLKGWVVRLSPNGIGIKFDRRIRQDRRKDPQNQNRRRRVKGNLI